VGNTESAGLVFGRNVSLCYVSFEVDKKFAVIVESLIGHVSYRDFLLIYLLHGAQSSLNR
jgi:hypothetical protein